MKKRGLFIILYILVFCVGVILGNFILFKNEKCEDNIKEVDSNGVSSGYYETIMNSYDGEQFENFNNIKFGISNGTIKINDVEVGTADYDVDFIIKNDIVIIRTYGIQDFGELYIYNNNLERLLYLKKKNENYNEKFEFITCKVFGNSIIIDVDSISHEFFPPQLNLVNEEHISFPIDGEYEGDIEQLCTNINDYKNLKVSRKFKIEYLGNGKVGDLEEIGYQTVEDYFNLYYNTYCS